MEPIEFNSAKEFVAWLIDNEGKVLADTYGRRWKYEQYKFWFMDLGVNAFENSLKCVHLFGTNLYVL